MDELKELFEEAFDSGQNLCAYNEGYTQGVKQPPTFEEWFTENEEKIKKYLPKGTKKAAKMYNIRREVLNMPWDSWERFPKNKNTFAFTVSHFVNGMKDLDIGFLSAKCNEEEKEFLEKVQQYREAQNNE